MLFSVCYIFVNSCLIDRCVSDRAGFFSCLPPATITFETSVVEGVSGIQSCSFWLVREMQKARTALSCRLAYHKGCTSHSGSPSRPARHFLFRTCFVTRLAVVQPRKSARTKASTASILYILYNAVAKKNFHCSGSPEVWQYCLN